MKGILERVRDWIIFLTISVLCFPTVLNAQGKTAAVGQKLIDEVNVIINYLSLFAVAWVVGCITIGGIKLARGDQDAWKKIKWPVIAGIIIGAAPQLAKWAYELGKGA